jgi:hypothetical protein
VPVASVIRRVRVFPGCDTRWVRRPTVAFFVVVIGFGAAAAHSTTARVSSTVHASCPKGVLADESSSTPVGVVLGAAQRQLGRRTINSQGTVYHLTPRNAPIDFVERVAAVGTGAGQTLPGLVDVHRVAVAACGKTLAQASWAIHYFIPVSVIAGAGRNEFIVKTRVGWRLWGYWCGADKPRGWGKTHCY